MAGISFFCQPDNIKLISDVLNNFSSEIDADNLDAYFNRALAYYNLEKYKKCCQDMKTAADKGYKAAKKYVGKYC